MLKVKLSKFIIQKMTFFGQILTILILINILTIDLFGSPQIIFGITGATLENNLGILIKWKNYLSHASGLRVKLKFVYSYSELQQQIINKKIDMAYICGSTYINLLRTKHVELLAIPLFHGKPLYDSLVVVRTKSKFKTLYNLRNHPYAYSDPDSSSGALIPQYELRIHGYNPELFFSHIIYTYNNEESINAVLSGYVDGASIDSIIYSAFIKQNPKMAKKLKVIEYFGPYTISPIVIRKTIDKNIKKKLYNALIIMNKTKRGISILDMLTIDKFISPKDINYKKIKKIMSVLQDIR